jgi:chromate transport protein ChrA
MKSNTNSENLIPLQDDEKLFSLRIIALWAFSESAFGGILHALAIPFRGLFIASAAVLFISMIGLFGKSNREILKATLIVILIKAVVSPHSPLTAYLAVSLQGLLGFLFFSIKNSTDYLPSCWD